MRAGIILALVVIELFAASLVQPYHDLAPPEVYTGQRFTISQMLAYADEHTPPGRTLAISGLLFDPGDKATLQARYDRLGLDEQAARHAFVATKRQEMLYPNLPLTWGIPSIDGFGGGVLPTIHYTQFTSLLLPDGTPDTLRAIDGRLGERLALPDCRGACIPDYRWLQLTGTQYLITDKVFDLWHEDVAYDTAWNIPVTSERGTSFTTPQNAPFVADRIDVLYSSPDETAPVISLLETTRAEPSITLDGLTLTRYALPEATPLERVRLSSGSGEVTQIQAVTLVDTRTGAFVQLNPAAWQRALSSDIKIYRTNTAQLDPVFQPSRARIISDIIPLPDTWQGSEDALDILAAPDFDPMAQAVIHGVQPSSSNPTPESPPQSIEEGSETNVNVVGRGLPSSPRPPSPQERRGSEEARRIVYAPRPETDQQVPLPLGEGFRVRAEQNTITFLTYTPTQIEMAVTSAEDAYLVLADAYYPGWQATVNGDPTGIHRADVMFRAVRIPAAERRVTLSFQPQIWFVALGTGVIAWGLALVMLVVVWLRWRIESSSHQEDSLTK